MEKDLHSEADGKKFWLSEVDGVADMEEGDFLAWQQYSVNFMKRSFPEHLSSGPSAVKAVTFLDPEYQNYILVFL